MISSAAAVPPTAQVRSSALCAACARGALGRLARERGGLVEQVGVWHHAVDDAEPSHLRRRHTFGGEGPLHRLGPSRPLGDPVDPAEERDDRDGLLGVAEGSAFPGEHYVAAQDQLEPAAEAQPLHGGHRRHGEPLVAVEDRHELLEVAAQLLLRPLRPGRDVAAVAEVAALGAQQDRSRAARLHHAQRVVELGDHLQADAVLGCVVQHDRREVVLDGAGAVGHDRTITAKVLSASGLVRTGVPDVPQPLTVDPASSSAAGVGRTGEQHRARPPTWGRRPRRLRWRSRGRWRSPCPASPGARRECRQPGTCERCRPRRPAGPAVDHAPSVRCR